MITALALAVILSTPVQDKIDFQLGWKKGDKFTYTVNTSSSFGGMNITGELILTVTKVEDTSFTVSTSRVEFNGEGSNGMQPIAAGSMRLSKTGKILHKEGSDLSNAAVFFMFLALPEKAVAVGDAFRTSMKMAGTSGSFDGKFVSLSDPNKSLATFESEGSFLGTDGIEAPIKLKTTFDITNGNFVSHVATWHGGAIIHSFKLKEPAK